MFEQTSYGDDLQKFIHFSMFSYVLEVFLAHSGLNHGAKLRFDAQDGTVLGCAFAVAYAALRWGKEGSYLVCWLTP